MGFKTYAVIVAAGSSTRMGGKDKLDILLDEMPVLAHAISAFSTHPDISGVVVVTRRDKLKSLDVLMSMWGLNENSTIVEGGVTRQQSVINGLAVLPEDCDYVAVHDGARPLVTGEIISRCIKGARQHGCATAAIGVKDTVMIADGDRMLVDTPNRDNVYNCQTPQVFSKPLLEESYKTVINDNKVFTDDTQVVSYCGGQVKLVIGSYDNIKITTAEDLATARFILQERKK